MLTVAIIATRALGIGAVTTICSVVSVVTFSPARRASTVSAVEALRREG